MMALQISPLFFLIRGFYEVYLINEWIPIQGNILQTQVMLPPFLANCEHLRKMMMTAGAAIIVPYMYREVTIEITMQYAMDFRTLIILSFRGISVTPEALIDTVADFIYVQLGKTFIGLQINQFVSNVFLSQKKYLSVGVDLNTTV